MKSRLLKALLLGCAGSWCLYFYMVIQHPELWINVLQQTPFYEVIHYRWDLSSPDDSSSSVTALLTPDLQTDGFTLTLSGNGPMQNFDPFAPSAWHRFTTSSDDSLLQQILSVSIETDVTSIGNYVFNNMHALTTVHLPDTLNTIHSNAFTDCPQLNQIIFCGTLEQWNSIHLQARWIEPDKTLTVHCSNGSVHYPQKPKTLSTDS